MATPEKKRRLSCSVCLESFDLKERLPRTLPCFHSSCESCLKGLLGQRASLGCPECRQVCRAPAGVKSFQQNQYIVEQLEDNEAAQMCSVEGHSRHSLNLYCKEEDCKKVLCALCAIKEHQQHDVVDLEDETEKRRAHVHEKLLKAAEAVKGLKTNLVKEGEDLSATMQKTIRKLQEKKAEVVKAFDVTEAFFRDWSTVWEKEVDLEANNAKEDLSELESDAKKLEGKVRLGDIAEIEQRISLIDYKLDWSYRTTYRLLTCSFPYSNPFQMVQDVCGKITEEARVLPSQDSKNSGDEPVLLTRLFRINAGMHVYFERMTIFLRYRSTSFTENSSFTR